MAAAVAEAGAKLPFLLARIEKEDPRCTARIEGVFALSRKCPLLDPKRAEPVRTRLALCRVVAWIEWLRAVRVEEGSPVRILPEEPSRA